MTEFGPAEVTQLLLQVAAGDKEAEGELYNLTFEELRRIAHGQMQWEANGTLQTTDLVHEAYLRIKKEGAMQRMDNRRLFFGAVTLATRRILVEAARKRRTQKRGGELNRLPIDHVVAFYEARNIDLEALDEALEELGELRKRQAEVVQLRWISGMPIKEVAKMLGVSEWTVEEDWRTARAFLFKRLSELE